MSVRFYNCRILKMTDDKIIEGELWTDNDRISYIGPSVDVSDKKFDREIDCKGNLLMPGLKNAHTHSAMTFSRSLADEYCLNDWLHKAIFPREAKLTPEAVYWFSKLAYAEYLAGGVTACFDMYFHREENARAAVETGFRHVFCGAANDFGGFESLEKYYNEKFEKEFDYLYYTIDEDRYHLVGLVKKNELCRYIDIRPYDYNYVEIKSEPKFINASWIHMPHPFYFIATQGPLEKTIEDFLSMCIEYDVQFIVMLCNVEEEGREKCAKYWDRKFTNYEVLKRIESTILKEGIILRRLKIKKEKDNLEKNIDQIQFTCWDDHKGLNYEYFEKIREIINEVDMYKQHQPNSPIVVHCSAGVGRTGTFICLYMIYKEVLEQILDKNKTEIKFSIMNLVRKIKEMRLYSVENEYQYTMLYMFANYLLLKYNN